MNNRIHSEIKSIKKDVNDDTKWVTLQGEKRA